MEDWLRQETEYKQSLGEHTRSFAELRRSFRAMDWWPELDGSDRKRLEEMPAYRDFKEKLDKVAESGVSERLSASNFWDTHMPKEYAKPEWYTPVDASVFDESVAKRAHVSAMEVAEGGNRDVDRIATLAGIRDQVAMLRANLERHHDGISEDSYAIRLEAWQDLVFVSHFEGAIAHLKPGDELDLRRVGINYGYDPEEVYSDRSVGLEYLPAIERERSQYESDIHRLQSFIDGLEDAGVKVRREFRELWHDEHDPRIFGASQESLNRFLDLKTEAPALIGILYDIGIARLTMEERYERIDVERHDLSEKADRDLGFLTRFERAISEVGSRGIIDMRVFGIGDADARDFATPALRNGLHHVQAGVDTKSVYDAQVAGIEKYIFRLEEAGVTVLTGFRDGSAKGRVQESSVEQSRSDRSQFEREQKYAARQANSLNNESRENGPPRHAAAYWAAIAKSSSIGLGQKLSQTEVRTQYRGRGR